MAQRSGYIGESLEALVTEATMAATHALERDIVETARDVLFTTAQAATPVGKTGAVRNSWLPQPIWPHGPDRWQATVRNDHWIAHLLNYGTEAHEIDPKRKRAETTPEGPRASAHVRGIRPHHMAEIACETTAQVIEPMTYPARQRWKREVEFAISRAKREQLR